MVVIMRAGDDMCLTKRPPGRTGAEEKRKTAAKGASEREKGGGKRVSWACLAALVGWRRAVSKPLLELVSTPRN